MKYSKEFEDAVSFAKEHTLFLGYGNPNGKILIVGKEHYFHHKHNKDTKDFYDEIVAHRNVENINNALSWENNIKNKFVPNWDSVIPRQLLDSNPQTKYWNQKNKRNRQLKSGQWNGGTSSTYTYYQKIYQNVFLSGNKEECINFQKEFFITELNDLPAKKDYKFQKLKELKNKFITERQNLFNLPYFKSFPVVIIASGHYSRDFNFDIEKTFEVEWDKETKISNSTWYNLHKSSDEKRLVIHTRQLSNRVSNIFIDDMSELVKEFLQSSIEK